MDKGWINLPRYSNDYINGVESFLEFAFTKGRPQGGEILCPCVMCCNLNWRKRDVVLEHLVCKGFVQGYNEWVYHGEGISGIDSNGDVDDEMDSCDDIDGLLYDTFRDVVEEEGIYERPNEDARKFYNLIEEAKEELYLGCKNFSKLSFSIRLYLLKCLHGWSNASFTALLELMKEAMPHLNIPQSFNQTKGMIRDLGLDYNKIDACPNDCMLYWKEHANDTSCHICGASRWAESSQVDCEAWESKKAYKVPAKILRHFPLIPRLKRLFMCAETASSLRWHEEERSKDGKLRHPADGQAWKDFDELHPDFAHNSRNIRLGLFSDGFNPYRTMSISHSTWPVVLMTYNLPPWMCMKPEFYMLSLLIPGPRSPGNDIDVYLEPLIDELKLLWDIGVETYDVSRNETFLMRACLLWTINDFPAYAMLSGWSTKGKFACPCCNYGTSSKYLKHSRKMCYMDHRVFLPMNHRWRSNSSSFDGKTEHRPPPPLLGRERLSEELDKINHIFGKTQKKNDKYPLKKRSIFFELPYWEHNTLRHNLDVMHIEKNICDNIIGTLLEIPGKTKDHAKARLDLQDMGIRKNLQPTEMDGGKKIKLPRACYSMTTEEKSSFCSVLKSAKLPDGCASNISRCVQVDERKVSNYKSHDAHFMLHYLLPVAIKGLLPDHVAIPLIRLCSFFRCLCQKVIQVEDLIHLEAEIAETLCQLERIFPPSFFDIMVHLPIHLANEVRLGGPVQSRYMFPPERYMCKLKSYVRNKSRPEGSIAEAYLVEECLTFCSRYLHSGVDKRSNRMGRNSEKSSSSHADASSIGHPIGAKKLICLDQKSLNQAHRYILFNCDDVQQYIREHEGIVNSQSGKRKWSKAKSHSNDFIQWFETRARNVDISDFVKGLSRGPNIVVKKFSGYVINGYRFHTRMREGRCKTQNSGVTLEAITRSFASSKDERPRKDSLTYYGAITDIIELNYYELCKYVLFKCDWFEVKEDNYGMKFVHFDKRCYQQDPFVLASQVHQCFYVGSHLDENIYYVMKTVPRDLFNIGDQSDGGQEFHWGEPSDSSSNPTLPVDDGEVDLVRTDVPATIIDQPLPTLDDQSHEIDYEEDSDFDDTDWDYMD